MELRERLKHKGNLFRKNLQLIKCLLILDLMPFRSYVKEKHSIGRKLQSLAKRRKKLLTDILLTSRNIDRKIVHSIENTQASTKSQGFKNGSHFLSHFLVFDKLIFCCRNLILDQFNFSRWGRGEGDGQIFAWWGAPPIVQVGKILYRKSV